MALWRGNSVLDLIILYSSCALMVLKSSFLRSSWNKMTTIWHIWTFEQKHNTRWWCLHEEVTKMMQRTLMRLKQRKSWFHSKQLHRFRPMKKKMKVINVKSHFLFSHLFHSLQQSLTIKYIERHSCYICYDGLQLLTIITKLCNIIYSNCGHKSLCISQHPQHFFYKSICIWHILYERNNNDSSYCIYI